MCSKPAVSAWTATPTRSVPATPSWRRILAHELAQLLVAERGGGVERGLRFVEPAIGQERGADAFIKAALGLVFLDEAAERSVGRVLGGVGQHAEQRDDEAARIGVAQAGAGADVDQGALQLVIARHERIESAEMDAHLVR